MTYLSKPHYEIKDPDYDLSPYTGITRSHWVDCGSYILGKAFERYAPHFDKLMEFPKVNGKTYPHPNDPDWRFRSAALEVIRRTSYLAFPLIHNDPDLELNSIPLRKYYKHHLMHLLKGDSPERIPYPDELDSNNCYQFTCELGGLCMELLCFPDLIWPDLTREEKDSFADMVSKWAHYETHPHNWRYFNVSMLTFLKLHGYDIDEGLLKTHMYHLLSLYSGDGWNNDGHFDYYSVYVMNVYGAIWCKAYGYENEPDIAARIEHIIIEMFKNYSTCFGRNGYIPMWGRSILYRFSAIAGFPLAYFLKTQIDINPGWARRICSGALLQFATRDDFYHNDIPSLGYYGYREYCLQTYSSAGSPFSMFIPYISLALSEESPFWSAVENEGDWDKLGNNAKITELKGPGIVSVQYGQTGVTELHTGKVASSDQNYNKLCYNTHFPWEDEDLNKASAMQYILKTKQDSTTDVSNVQPNLKGCSPVKIYYIGVNKGVIYRQIILGEYYLGGIGLTIDLAEIVLPQGILRVDRCRLGGAHILQLGHFGLPHIGDNKPVIDHTKVDGNHCITGSIQGRQLAFVTLNGWDKLAVDCHTGKNAETDDSTVIYASREKESYKDATIDLLISLMLHRTDNKSWDKQELMPVKHIAIHEIMPGGSVYGAEIELKSGEQYIVDFKEIDGRRFI